MAPLADIIKQSACLAISRGTDTGREEITRDLMDEIILDHWSALEYAEVKEVKARKARGSRQGHFRRAALAGAELAQQLRSGLVGDAEAGTQHGAARPPRVCQNLTHSPPLVPHPRHRA